MTKAAIIIVTMIFFTGLYSAAQLKSVVVDNYSKEKIPYVSIWVENENISTTSNEEGAWNKFYRPVIAKTGR